MILLNRGLPKQDAPNVWRPQKTSIPSRPNPDQGLAPDGDDGGVRTLGDDDLPVGLAACRDWLSM